MSFLFTAFINGDESRLLIYKLSLMMGGFFLASVYWGLTDSGWFSAPLFFLQIGLLWALFYFITVNPDIITFALIYNRFADLAYFFIIGSSIYRIRAINRLKLKKQLENMVEADLNEFHEELSPKKFPFHRYHEYIKE